MNRRIAIVRIRGGIGIKKPIKDTLAMLRLYRKNSCIIVPNTPVYVGMLKKVKDYVTWGEINEKTFRVLLEKRGKLAGNKPLAEEYLKQKIKKGYDGFIKEFFEFKKELKDIPGLKLFFRLKPPERGFERKGIKKQFSVGGVLGYRGDKINDLIMRMI
jgi:large subunit ribosomal protein L30